jgi:hypothetical protein
MSALLWVASIEYAPQDLTLSAEYSRWHIALDSSEPAIVPDRTVTSERAYAMGSYRVNSWLTPGAYYSVLFADVEQRRGRDAHQHDFAATVRFDLTMNWLLKLEGHFMRGTADLTRDLNGGRELDTLTRDWGVFLAKTTAYF